MSWLKSLAAIFLSKEIGTIPAIVAGAGESSHAAKNEENPDYGDWI